MTIFGRISHLWRMGFIRRVATLQVGSFAGNFVQALIGVFLARLLQPELFGIYTLAFGLASLASIILGAGAQDAMATVVSRSYAEKNRREITDALAFLLKISVITALLALVFSMFLPQIAEAFYHNSKIGEYASLVVYGSIISTLFFSMALIGLQVSGRITTMAVLTVSDQTLRYSISLILVILGAGVYGAASGHLWGAAIIAVVSLVIWRKLSHDFSLLPGFLDIVKHARIIPLKKYFSFSFWTAIDRNIGSIYMTLPVILTGAFVATTEITYFKLAFGYINLGLSLLGPISTMLNVEFPKSQVEDKSKLLRNFNKVSLYSLGISTILTAGLIIISPFAFKILYGEAFLPSIKYAFALFAYGALFGIGVGLGPMWRAINKVKVSILINLIVLGIGVPLGWFLVKTMGLWGAVWMVTIWFTASHLISFIYLKNYLKKV